MSGDVALTDVTAANWRAVAALRVHPGQAEWVAEPAYYLCLCHYGGDWHPLAVTRGGTVVGFLMWAPDDDGSRWIGGLLVDAALQRQGIGRRALELAVERLAPEAGAAGLALSYAPANPARALYAALGFAETGERMDDEVVARR